MAGLAGMTHDHLETAADAAHSDVLRKDAYAGADAENPVLIAIARNDWDALRKLSLASGGFGEHRKQAWYVAFPNAALPLFR